jgi:hypothetical protein
LARKESKESKATKIPAQARLALCGGGHSLKHSNPKALLSSAGIFSPLRSSIPKKNIWKKKKRKEKKIKEKKTKKNKNNALVGFHGWCCCRFVCGFGVWVVLVGWGTRELPHSLAFLLA